MKKTNHGGFFDNDGFSLSRKISGIGGLGITGKGDSAARRGGVQGEKGIPPLLPRNTSGRAGSMQYHSSVASNAKASNVHGRIDWSSK